MDLEAYSSFLAVVALPIGCDEDLSPRGKRILQSVDLVACEDTRRAGLFWKRLNLSKPPLGWISYFDHGEKFKAELLIKKIKGTSLKVALISDAGTPMVSDPGYHLVRLAHEAGIPVFPVPGPSAPMTLLSVSGLSGPWLIAGFLPKLSSQREALYVRWQKEAPLTVIFFQPTRNLLSVLVELKLLNPSLQVTLGREMTKVHEEYFPPTRVDQMIAALHNHPFMKGEATVAVRFESPLPPALPSIPWDSFWAKGLSVKDVLPLAKHAGFSSKDLYNLKDCWKKEKL